MSIKREHNKRISSKKASAFKGRKRSGKDLRLLNRGDFRVLEDSRDLSTMDHIIAEGVHSAYLRAINTADSIIEVYQGQVVRRMKNGEMEVISRLETPRQVEVGAKVTLSK